MEPRIKDGYPVDIKITARDRLGLLADIGSVFRRGWP